MTLVSNSNPLGYDGVTAPNPPNMIMSRNAPTSTQIHYPLGTFWFNVTNGFLWYLAAVSNYSAVWTLIATTDPAFAGIGTLALGTATITTSGVSSNSLIILSRTVINGSTALGDLTIPTVTDGVSFVVTSVQPAAPAVTETNDTSKFVWWIIS